RRRVSQATVHAFPRWRARHGSPGSPGPPDGADGKDAAHRARHRRRHCVHPPAGARQMIRAVAWIAALALAATAVANVIASGPDSAGFTLNSACPPGFEKTGAGVCELR